jgi:peptidoglycan/xylan/chitin deacetylase (PgdA/CDA1 family)
MKRLLAARILGATGLRAVLSRVVRWSGVLGLNYHRIGVAGRSPFDWGLWSAAVDEFDAQVRWLKSRFDVIGADDLPDALARRRGRHVLVTFDDGYRDNYTAAFPVLKRHRVPATFFIATGFIDRPRLAWWDEIAWMARTSQKAEIDLRPWLPAPVSFDEPDRERAVRALLVGYKALPAAATDDYLGALGEAAGTGRCDPSAAAGMWMTWDMIREMRAAGMSVGGHTVNHPVLAQMPRAAQLEEIVGCGRRLEAELREPMRSFSYPVGYPAAFNADTRDCLREAGVRFAFSYYGGVRSFDEWDDYDIRRLAVESYTTRDWFKAMVALPHVFGRSTG